MLKVNDMNISEKIKHFGGVKNLFQKELATSIGMDRAQYSRIESSKVQPTVSSLEKIANALGISVA